MTSKVHDNRVVSKQRLAVFVLAISILVVARIALVAISAGMLGIRRHRYEAFVRQYGWTVTRCTYSHSITLSDEYISSSWNQQKIDASMEIGLDPLKHAGREVSLYECTLDEPLSIEGDDANLFSQLWVVDGAVIGAWISHTTQNRTIQFWPLDSNPTQIEHDIIRVG